MDALQMFLLRHQALHASLATRLFSDLTDEQVRQRPNEQLNSIAWIVWHAARAEDFAVNRVVTDGKQVLDQTEWPTRLNIARRDIATGMNDDEVAEFSANVNIAALQAYCEAVGQRTREVVQHFQPADLDAEVDAEHVQQAFAEKGAVTEAGAWVSRVFEKRIKGDVLAQIALTHTATHFGEALTTRALLGHRGR